MARADDDRRTVEELAADRSLLNITPYIEDGWQYKHTIGSGACGDVWRARYVRTDPTTEQKLSYSVVIKAIRGTPKERPKIEERLNREIIAWRALSHPNVAEFLGIVERKNGPLRLVSRWVQRHDFAAYMRRHPEQKRKKAQDIASGLTYLHSKGVVHGDMKIDNIVVTDELRAQIIDFGISRLVGVKGFTTLAQRNVRFSAPELIPLQENPNTVIRPTYESDIYSLGILLLQLFDGHGPSTQRGMSYNHIPYQGDYDIALSTLIHKGERPQRHRYEPMLDQHWIIIELCWQQDPSDRPAAAEVLRRL